MTKRIYILAAILLLTACDEDKTSWPLLVKESNGQITKRPIPQQAIATQLTSQINNLQTALTTMPEDKQVNDSGYQLSRVSLGLDINTKFGVSPLFKAGTLNAFDLGFEKGHLQSSKSLDQLRASSVDSFEIPSRWYLFPEEMMANKAMPTLKTDEWTKALTNYNQVMDQIASQSSSSTWVWSDHKVGVGLSQSSVLGLFPVNGNSVFTTRYNRKGFVASSSSFSEQTYTVAANESQAVEKLFQQIMSRVKVKNPTQLKKNLFLQYEEFKKISEQLASLPPMPYKLSSWSWERSVNAKGSLLGFLNTEAVFRYKWTWTQRGAFNPDLTHTPLNDFVAQLASDLSRLDLNFSNDYAVKNVRFAITWTSTSLFGLLPGGLGAGLELNLSPLTGGEPPAQVLPPSLEALPIFKPDMSGKIAKKIKREKLLQGIAWAASLGHKVSTTLPPSTQHWSLSELEVFYRMSVGGDFAFNTYDAQSSLAITYKRK